MWPQCTKTQTEETEHTTYPQYTGLKFGGKNLRNHLQSHTRARTYKKQSHTCSLLSDKLLSSFVYECTRTHAQSLYIYTHTSLTKLLTCSLLSEELLSSFVYACTRTHAQSLYMYIHTKVYTKLLTCSLLSDKLLFSCI